MELMLIVILVLLLFVLLISIKQVNQYERGVKFRFGRFVGVLEPGWRIILPIIEGWKRVDIRVKAVDVPDQEAITLDNVSARVNAVIYYRIDVAQKAILEVEDYFFAVSQMAQTTMRNVIGETSLDDLLSKRDQVADRIKTIIDKATDAWGIKVESVELKDIIMPDEMKRVIARQAEAERERRAIIIKAEGEKAAAQNISSAASTLSKTTGGLHIRTLQTLSEISGDKNNTIVVVTPLEVLRAFEGLAKKIK
ncbi:MAG: slipin family protein [Candidatus Curtissbacteria bacterium]|nr:slipin family protein [Candidatus Curtissbacteria bacterium]